MNIGSAITSLLFTSLTLALGIADAGTDPTASCRWDGSAPACDGSCGKGESEITRKIISDATVQGMPSVNFFGDSCVTGSKAYCCRTPGFSCRWAGTAPACAGECESFEKASVPPPGSESGQACVTGSKVYCCHAVESTGSAGAALQASPQFARFAAIWQKNSGPLYVARHAMTSAQYQAQFDTLKKQGYRLVNISGYGMGGKDYYAAIWEKSPGPARVAQHFMTADQYQAQFDTLNKQGFRLIEISGYTVGGQDRYAAIWEKSPGPDRVARHGMTSAQYQDEFNKLAKQGYRLVRISGWWIGGTNHYAAIWDKSSGSPWVARHGLMSDGFQEEFNHRAKDGYRLIQVSGYDSYR